MKIIDMHCDTLSAMLNRKRQGQTYGLDQHHTQISLDWMQQSGYLLQNFAVFVNLEETQTPLQDALEMIDLFYWRLIAILFVQSAVLLILRKISPMVSCLPC